MNECLAGELVQAVIAVLVAVFILGLFGWLKFKRDEKIVSQLLGKSGAGTSRADRKTGIIVSVTRGSEGQIKRERRKTQRIKKRDRNGD